MAYNIVQIKFGIEGSPTFIYQGGTYLAEDFPFKVHCRDYDYILRGPKKRWPEIEKIILEIDEIFEKLKGGVCKR